MKIAWITTITAKATIAKRIKTTTVIILMIAIQVNSFNRRKRRETEEQQCDSFGSSSD